jgi:membrane protein
MKKQFINELYKTWVTERPNQLAAALAYYGMFSFAPIIFIAVSIVGLFIEKIDPTELLVQRLEERFGAEISSLVQSVVTALSTTPSNTSWLISVISFLALLFTASGLFYQLQFSLNKIWHVLPPEKGKTTSFIRLQLFSFIIVIGFGFLGVIAIFTEVLLSWFGSTMERLVGLVEIQSLMARIVAPILLTIIIALFYKILPETKVAWRDVSPPVG